MDIYCYTYKYTYRHAYFNSDFYLHMDTNSYSNLDQAFADENTNIYPTLRMVPHPYTILNGGHTNDE